MVENWQQWDGRIVNGAFPLRQYLGGSDYGVVYLTETEGTRAAIKLVGADAPHSQEQVASWKLAGRLAHPNLVRVLKTGLWHADDEQDMVFAVTEYCEESLAGVLRQRPLTAQEAREMLAPTMAALGHLHTQHLVHGQLKPTNILAAGDQLKLSTDGVQRADETRSPRTSGPYDAPETRLGTVSPASDIWSLGVTLMEALTNRLPGRDADGNPELTEKLPSPFDAIAKGCLVPEPQKRLSLAGIYDLLNPAPSAVKKGEAKPAAVSTSETKVIAKAETKPAAIPAKPTVVMPEIPLSAAKVTAPVRESRPASTVSSREETPQHAALGKRGLMLLAAAVIAILAIIVGMRLARSKPEGAQPAPPVVVGQGDPTTTPASTPESPAAATTTASTVPGTVLHEVMPEVSKQARSTITGTVKVKVRLAVDAQGKVTGATLAGSPSKYFGRQAQVAAREWTFVAPVNNGKAQSSDWTLTFEFRRSGTKVNARRTKPA